MDHEPEDLVGEPVDDVDADRRARLFPAPPVGVDVIGGLRGLTNIRAWSFQRVG